MKRLMLYTWCLLCMGLSLAAQSPVALDWARAAESGPLRELIENGSARVSDEGELTLDCPEEGCAWTLFELDEPKIQERAYSLQGQVRYEGVVEQGMLELLNDFASGQYFTRTVGEGGPLGALKGDSDWRAVALPFDTLGKESPSKLTLRLVLPGEGRISLSSLTLTQAGSMEELFGGAAVADPRWMGWGVIVGAGAIIGVLSGLGRARTVVLSLAWLVLTSGLAAIAFGVYVRSAQRYGGGSWISTGLMFVIMAGLMVPFLRRRYAQLELRKMRAMDA